jgi:dimethylargininase
MMHYTCAITRQPGPNFADGITTSGLARPDYQLAQHQHAQYCRILSQLGLAVEILPPDPRHPDGCFVEDAAIITENGTILTNPGDPRRCGETTAIEQALAARKQTRIIARVTPPGTLDGGDILRIGDKFIIGLSNRTNAAGAERLTAALNQLGYEAQTIRIPADLLHLKTGVTYIGQNTLIAWPSLAEHEAFAEFNKIIPTDNERYAANTLAVNGTVLVPTGFPGVTKSIEQCGLAVIETPTTEFQKMDGGLTCLSLLF